MYTRTRPARTFGGPPLREDQFETSQVYLARERRLLFLRGSILGVPSRWDQFGPAAVHDAILAINYDDRNKTATPKRPIYLLIDSEGGSVSDGLILYDVIRASQVPVYTVALNAASMATLILASGHRRLVYPHASLMIHLPMAALKGDVKQIEVRTRELNRTKDAIVEAYRTCGVKRTSEEILQDMDRESWMSAEDAVAYGLADAIVAPDELMEGTDAEKQS
jgi:ATP-dependent Clp protease protease subunit